MPLLGRTITSEIMVLYMCVTICFWGNFRYFIVNFVKLCINGQYNLWGNYSDSGVDIDKGNRFVINTINNI